MLIICLSDLPTLEEVEEGLNKAKRIIKERVDEKERSAFIEGIYTLYGEHSFPMDLNEAIELFLNAGFTAHVEEKFRLFYSLHLSSRFKDIEQLASLSSQLVDYAWEQFGRSPPGIVFDVIATFFRQHPEASLRNGTQLLDNLLIVDGKLLGDKEIHEIMSEASSLIPRVSRETALNMNAKKYLNEGVLV